MNLDLLALVILPVLVYVVLEKKKGQRAALKFVIGFGAFAIVWSYFRFGEVDLFMICEGLGLMGFGLVALKMDKPVYFKLQPAVFSFAFFLVFAAFEWLDRPFILEMLPKMQKLATPELAEMMLSEVYVQTSAAASFNFIWIFLVHGIVALVAALKWSTPVWAGVRLAIYPMLLVGTVVAALS